MRLIGRTGELQRLAYALDDVARGRGQCAAVLGEPGIGKTRLAEEVLVNAARRGFDVLQARASPLQAGLAYALVLEVFGQRLRSMDQARRAALVRDLDDLGLLFGGLGLPTPESLRDASLERTRLFEAIAMLLERLAAESPIVLFVDDLHWADSSSLDVLHYLGRRLPNLPVLLLATYRDDSPSLRQVRPLLEELRRADRLREVRLTALGGADLAVFAAELLDGTAPPELAELLQRRAPGIPLFAEALVRSLLESGALHYGPGGWRLEPEAETQHPAAAHDAILGRLDHLDETGRRIVDMLAVAGEPVAPDLLANVAELSDAALASALEHLRTAGLVDEELTPGALTYRLHHPLFQEVAYAEMGELRRRRAHASFVKALEQRQSADLARLAGHYRGALPLVDLERATDVLIEAGRQALGVWANREAARLLGAALELVQQRHRDELLPALLEDLGTAWDRLGETAAAVAMWSEAAALLDRAHDHTRHARVRHALGLAEFHLGHIESALQHTDTGLEVLAGMPPSPLQAELLVARARFLNRLGNAHGAAVAVDQLVDVANHLGSSRVQALAYLARVDMAAHRGAAQPAFELALRASDIALATGDPTLAFDAHRLVVSRGMAVGDHARILDRSLAQQQLARRLGAPHLEARAVMEISSAQLLSGDWVAADSTSAQALALAQRFGSLRTIAQTTFNRGRLLALRGDLDEAAEVRAELGRLLAPEALADTHLLVIPGYLDCMLAIEHGRAPDADALKWALMARDWGATIAQWVVGEALVLANDPERALELAATLRSGDSDVGILSTAYADWIEGAVAKSRGDQASAREAYARAAEGLATLRIPYDAARARLEWAELVTPDQSITVLREVLAVFDTLGARRMAARARQLLRKLGVAPPTTARPRTSASALSPRECEVAGLFAAGLSTAAVAERLVISPHTAKTHLKRIYEQLGISSRTELARYAIQAGWLPTSRDTPPESREYLARGTDARGTRT